MNKKKVSFYYTSLIFISVLFDFWIFFLIVPFKLRMKMIALTLMIETNRVMSFLPSSMTKEKLRGPEPQHIREEL